ncbi:MAG TPA: bacterial proteasome activator family protein [Acidimicrobiales bacterium]|nr:bacterial proteasome activator family protein [Acidimicrobiales bacterium]
MVDGDATHPGPGDEGPLRPEVVDRPGGSEGPAALTVAVGADPAQGTVEPRPAEESNSESIERPAKLLRIGSMVKQLLEEVRQAPLDEAGRSRLGEIYETSVRELADGLSPDLREELSRLSMPLGDGVPSEAELRVAQAQLVGWLEGLFHGIQATLFAQQVAAQNQLQQIRQRGLPQGGEGPDGRPGTYL